MRAAQGCASARLVFLERSVPDYSATIAAIDAAILAWSGKPVKLTEGGAAGRAVEYRSLDDLLKARKYYASLQAQSTAPSRGFKIGQFTAGDAK